MTATKSFANFSYSGAADLDPFNNSCNGGDFGNWQNNPLPLGARLEVQDAFATPGARPTYGPNEVAAMTAIGNIDPRRPVSEPGTFALVLISPAVLWARTRYVGASRRVGSRPGN